MSIYDEALFGTIALSLWGGPERKVFGVLGCAFLQGLLLAAVGLYPSSTLILVVAFLYMALIPLVRVSRQSIWMCKVPADMHGRVLAVQVLHCCSSYCDLRLFLFYYCCFCHLVERD